MSWSPEAEELQRMLERFCASHAAGVHVDAEPKQVIEDLWRPLAETGVLALATPAGGGGHLDIAAAMEVLGAAAFPGPIAATVLANQLLDGDDLAAVGDGSTIVVLGTSPVLAWATVADRFLVVDAPGTLCWAEAAGPVVPTRGVAGTWSGRVELRCVEAVPPERARRGLAAAEAASASYLAAAGSHLVADASAYAKDRHQFGRPIGDFQAVAFPLVECHARLTAAAGLARRAAEALDDVEAPTSAEVERLAALAALSARRAALQAVAACHQVLGAVGFAAEGPMTAHRSRIAEHVLLPPVPQQLEHLVL